MQLKILLYKQHRQEAALEFVNQKPYFHVLVLLGCTRVEMERVLTPVSIFLYS